MRRRLGSRLRKGSCTAAAAGHGVAKVQVQSHAAFNLPQGFIVRTHAADKRMRTAGILYIVKLSLERVYFLTQGLKLVPRIGLGWLHLAQLHVLLLHLLFQ